MDHRHQATPLAAVILGVLLALPGAPAVAQEAKSEAQVAGDEAAAGSNIFGTQALPKGLTIVPWKKGTPGELTAGPTRLVDEPLAPIDPEEFRRRLEYYQSQSKGS